MNNTACFKDFIKYSFLNVLGMIGLSCYILADTFFISKGLGANGLTALNLALPVYSFIHGSGLMIGIGGGTKYSILKYQNKKNARNQVFTNAVVFTLLLAAVFFTAGIFCSGLIVKLLGADDAVFQMCNTYLQVILLFSPMFMLNNLLLCFIRNDGAPELTMAAMTGGSFSNIILDYIFIFPLNMGIFGAVLATGLAPVISMLILSSYFFKKKNHFHLCRRGISGSLLCSILSGGLPSLIAEASSGIVILVFNTILLRLEGNVGVAAYGVIANLSLVTMSIYTGIAQGIQPILCSNYGKGNLVNVRAILRYAMLTLLILSAALYLGIFFSAEQIAGIFNSEHNPVLQSIAATGLKYYFTACLFAGFNIILSVYFTSTEQIFPAQIISLLRGFLIILPMTFFLAAIGGVTGVWFSFPATELLVCIIGIFFLGWHGKNRRLKQQKQA